jgi:nucleoid DNA-binding protein
MAENKSAGAKPITKSEVYQQLATATQLNRKQVAAVFDELSKLIKQQLGKKGPGAFTIPGLLKLKLIRKPATKARKGKNPFTGQEQMFKAKPARNVVRARALKGLNELVK